MKRLLALIFMLVVAVAVFTACNRGDDETPGATGGQAISGAAGIDGWTAFENRVTLRVPVYERGVAGLPPTDNHYWTQWIQTNFGDVWNVDVEFVLIPRWEQIMTYNLLMAANNAPTIFMEYDYPILALWAYEGALAEIDLDFFAHVAPNYFQGMADRGQLIYTDIGGRTHLILSERPFHNTPMFHYNFYRMDWLRQVGFDSPPTSREEFVEAVTLIMDAGIVDNPPVPFTLPHQAFAGLTGGWGNREFPINEEEWAMHSSLTTTPVNWEPTREWVRHMNEDFHRGFFSQEFELREGADDEADFIAGRLLRHGGFMSPNVAWLNSFFELNPGAELAIGRVHDDHQARSDNPFGAIIGFSSAASDDEVRAAMMYMEWMLQPEVLFTLQHGHYGHTWSYGDDGRIVIDTAYEGPSRFHFNANVDLWMIIMASRVTGTPEESIRAHAPQGLPQDFTYQMLDAFSYIQAAADADRIYPDVFFSVPIPAEALYGGNGGVLHGVMNEWLSRLVRVDPAEFDALYDQFEAAYLAAGYQSIIDQRLEAFRAGNSTRLPDQARR